MDISRGEGAVPAAEARPVHLLVPSVVQAWLRTSQPQAASLSVPQEPPQAVDRDQKRILQTHSWIKLVLGLRSSKGGIQDELMEGPGAGPLVMVVRQPGVRAGLCPVQGVTPRLPSHPNKPISGSSWVSA